MASRIVRIRGLSVMLDADLGALICVRKFLGWQAVALQAYKAFTRHGGDNRAVRLLQRELRRADLELDFRVRGASIARLAGDTRGNLAGRLLHLGDTDLRIRGLLLALLPW